MSTDPGRIHMKRAACSQVLDWQKQGESKKEVGIPNAAHACLLRWKEKRSLVRACVQLR